MTSPLTLEVRNLPSRMTEMLRELNRWFPESDGRGDGPMPVGLATCDGKHVTAVGLTPATATNSDPSTEQKAA